MVDPISAALKAATNGMEVESLRLRTSHENLSNVDTPGFRRKLLSVVSGENASVHVNKVLLDDAEGRRVLDPAHPLADDDGYVTLSNVDMLMEVTDAREAKRNFEANLEAFRQAREMYSGLISLMRR
ncbi:MAG: flagellar basal body rod C-terminal domain-containing protein [Parvularcula sp.]